MNAQAGGSTPTPFDVDPDNAIEAILGFQGPALVDLDETLYLRNSTEDFIDTAAPGLIAMILLRFLDVARPWRFTGGEATRDSWRVRLIVIFFPWVGVRWRRRVAILAARHVNRPLFDALRASAAQPIVVTVGFESIVRPLIAALGIPDATLVAARGFGFHDRRRGKLAMAVEALGDETIRRSLVITDSPQDRPLLDAAARPLRTIWPDAKYRRALGRVYLPGEYLSRVKRPGERYIWRGIVQEDLAFWILSSISLAAHPLAHVLGLALLALSFWAIYERGYVDNDHAAAHFEHDPKLTAEYHEAPVATPKWQPWIWALLSGGAAILVLRAPLRPAPVDFLKWYALLGATHVWFRWYNRLDKRTRVWLYAGLQLARSAAFAVLVPVTGIGAIVLGAQALSRWVPYYSYRLGGTSWTNGQPQLIRLLFVITFIILLSATGGFHLNLAPTTILIVLWCLFRARYELGPVFSTARRLDKSATGKERG
ncbi:MAG: haloacid dehalogenase-like hydrolase [Gammaproteobacteria bacterium]|nr:haloacid dehalogenase-like hydrolase [Gammaproteobacteria bacterium]